MNFLKSGWSFLSSSFTQGEDEEAAEDDEFPASESAEAHSVLDPGSQRRGSLDSVDDFADAVDLPSDAQSAQHETQNSLGAPATPNQFGHRPGNSAMESTGDGSSSVDAVANQPVMADEVTEEYADNVQGAVGYTTLETSDSDDEVIPPPAAPVGPSVNTESQLNEIINNLGGDLGILTLEEEDQNEATIVGEATIGNTFYTTAYDQTLCPSPPCDTTVDEFAVTAIEVDLGAGSKNSSFDSAIASSSKSSNLSGDSVKLNLQSDAETALQSDTSKKPVTKNLIHPQQSDNSECDSLTNGDSEHCSPPDTPLFDDNPFQKSVLDSTVQEVEIDDQINNTVEQQDDFKESPQPDSKDNVQICAEPEGLQLPTAATDVEEVRESEIVIAEEQESEENAVNDSAPDNEGNVVSDLIPPAVEETRVTESDETEPTPVGEGISEDKKVEESLPSVVDESKLAENSLTETAEKPEVDAEKVTLSSDNTTEEQVTPTRDEEQPQSPILESPTTEDNEVKVESPESVSENPPAPVIEGPAEERAKPKMDDEIPVSRGSYNIDFENLDAFNPFQCNKALQNSPEKPAKSFAASIEVSQPCQDHTAIETQHTATEEVLTNGTGDVKDMPKPAGPDTVQVKANTINVPGENLGGGDADTVLKPHANLNDATANLENVDPSVTKPVKKVAKKPLGKKIARPVKKKPLAAIATPADDPAEEPGAIIPRGAYTIDFDNLDDFDPFKTNQAMSNSPTKSAPPVGLPEAKPPEEVEVVAEEVEPAPEPIVDTQADEQNVEYMELASNTAAEVANEDMLPEPTPEPELALTSEPPAVATEKQEEANDTSNATTDATVSNGTAGEEEALPPKGAYSIDFDNLGDFDPFKTSKGLANSPTKAAPSGYSLDFENLDAVDPFKPSKAMANSPPSSPTKVEPSSAQDAQVMDAAPSKDALVEEAAPVIEQESEAPAEIVESKAADKPEQETPVAQNELVKKTPKSGIAKRKINPALKKTEPTAPPPEAEVNGEDEIPIPKGTYNLDFDNLDMVDPFKTTKGLSNSPTKDAPASYSIDFDNLDSVDPFKSSKAMANSPPASPTKAVCSESLPVVTDVPSQEPEAEVVKDIQAEAVSPEVEQSKAESPAKTEEPKPTAIKKPMKKGVKSGLARKKLVKPGLHDKPTENPDTNAEEDIPVPKGAYNLDFDNLDSMDPFKSSKGLANSPTKSSPSGYSLNFDDMESVDPFKPSKAMANSPPSSPTKTTPPEKEEDVVASVVSETEPVAEKNELNVQKNEKKETKVLPGAKKKKIPTGLPRKKLAKPKPVSEPTEADEIPVPKGAYNLDFDNLDAMDPFKTSKGLSNSPTKEKPTTSAYALDLDNLENVDPFKSSKAMANSPPSSPVKIEAEISVPPEETPKTEPVDTKEESEAGAEQASKEPESTVSYEQLQKMEHDRLNETEQFYAASDVFQDGSLDYFDTLRTQPLTESELRKQSLYVKFDPLVSKSPVKQETIKESSEALPDSTPAVVHFPAKTEVDPPNEASAEVFVQKVEEPAQEAKVQSNVSMGSQSGMDSFSQPYLSQQSFQSPALKYTQADLDEMLSKVEQEWEVERKEAKSKEDTLTAELEQMNQVVKEYEQLFNAISTNENGALTREQQLAKAEHEQSLEDLAALERSHEDLNRRYNKLKSVVSQFKQNEEILKKSATEMMEEAKVTREKYVTLKKQTDEEISKASKELQQVKANAQQEVARAQAQLKMLELKCDSLQSQIRDCNNENEELTKLCDELITCSKEAQG